MIELEDGNYLVPARLIDHDIPEDTMLGNSWLEVDFTDDGDLDIIDVDEERLREEQDGYVSELLQRGVISEEEAEEILL